MDVNSGHGKAVNERLTPEEERMQSSPVCTVEGCSSDTVAKGYCWKHYRQVLRHGRLTPEREHVFGRATCTVEGCQRKHYALGYCERHYMQRRYAQRKAIREAAED